MGVVILADETLLIGTRDKRVELPQFLQGTERTRARFVNTTQLQNGATGVSHSASGSASKELKFSRMSEKEIWKIDNLVKGVYGDGSIYYFDPFVINLLTPLWSIPYLQKRDPTQSYGRQLNIKVIDTPNNIINLPVRGANVVRDSDEINTNDFNFLLPKDRDLAIGINGERVSGDIHFELDFNDGSTPTSLPFSEDITTEWQGEPNNSISLLKKNGNFVAFNFITSPDFSNNWSISWNAALFGGGGKLMSENGVNFIRFTQVAGKTGQFKFQCPIDFPQSIQASCRFRSNVHFDRVRLLSNSNYEIPANLSQWTTIQNDTQGDSTFFEVGFENNLSGDAGCIFDIAMPMLTNQAGWNAMQYLGISWFDGDRFDGDIKVLSGNVVTEIIENKNSDFMTIRLVGTGEMNIYGMTAMAVPRYIGSLNAVMSKYGNIFRAGDGMSGAKIIDQKNGYTEYALNVPWALSYSSITLSETEWSDN